MADPKSNDWGLRERKEREIWIQRHGRDTQGGDGSAGAMQIQAKEHGGSLATAGRPAERPGTDSPSELPEVTHPVSS